jgi:predicted glycosyltransferase
MKIVFYCQHVLGVGHFFRSLEICRALAGHEVTLVTGGPRFEVKLPSHVCELRLPELGMDPEFKQLLAAPGDDIETVTRVRQARLLALFEAERPELFVVELYPFGRKAFRFEIDPVLQAIAEGGRAACGVVCSVRDILVEKRMPAEHEAWVVAVLNRLTRCWCTLTRSWSRLKKPSAAGDTSAAGGLHRVIPPGADVARDSQPAGWQDGETDHRHAGGGSGPAR